MKNQFHKLAVLLSLKPIETELIHDIHQFFTTISKHITNGQSKLALDTPPPESGTYHVDKKRHPCKFAKDGRARAELWRKCDELANKCIAIGGESKLHA